MKKSVFACLVSTFAYAALSIAVHGQGTFVEPDVTVLHTFSPVSGGFGWAVADLTDIDGDDVTDLILPANSARQVFVYSGQSGSLIHHLLPPPGDPANSTFGHAVGDAGDVNGDGVNDIIVGSPTSSASPNPGYAYIFSGTDGSLLLTLSGEAGGDQFGFGVGGTGDVNGDSRDDVVVGAPANDFSGGASGRAYVFSGLDGSLIRPLNAEAAANRFGSGAAGTGDINGDGIGDQIIGAPNAGLAGRAYVFSGADGSLLFQTNSPVGGNSYGTFFVAGAGDVNNDGTLDVYVGDFGAQSGRGRAFVYSGLGGSLLHTFTGAPGDGGLGCGRGAGDVNGDGYADLVVGHYTSAAGAPGAGRVTVRSGRTGAILRTITSTTSGETLGFDAVGVGDTDGDGQIDLLLSAASQDRVYLIAGVEVPCPVPAAPLSDPSGILMSRYVGLLPGVVSEPTAIRVTLSSLHHPDPPNASGQSPNLTAFEGQARWVGPVVNCQDSVSANTFKKCAKLQCTPEYVDWDAALGGEVLYITGSVVVPSSEYDVHMITQGCDIESEDNYSGGVTLTTARWCDVVAPYQLPSPATVNQPNALDIAAQVDKVKDLPGSVIKPRGQMQPADVNPLQAVNAQDIGMAVDAAKGGAYPLVSLQSCP